MTKSSKPQWMTSNEQAEAQVRELREFNASSERLVRSETPAEFAARQLADNGIVWNAVSQSWVKA